MRDPNANTSQDPAAEADPADAATDWFDQSTQQPSPHVRVHLSPPFHAALLPLTHTAAAPLSTFAANECTSAESAMVIDAGTISSDEESGVVEAPAPAPPTSTPWPPPAKVTSAVSKRRPSDKSRHQSSQPPVTTGVAPVPGPMSSFRSAGLLVPAARSGRTSLPACIGSTQVARDPGCQPSRWNCRDPHLHFGHPIPPGRCPPPLANMAMLDAITTTPYTPSAAPPLSADLARVSLQATRSLRPCRRLPYPPRLLPKPAVSSAPL